MHMTERIRAFIRSQDYPTDPDTTNDSDDTTHRIGAILFKRDLKAEITRSFGSDTIRFNDSTSSNNKNSTSSSSSSIVNDDSDSDSSLEPDNSIEIWPIQFKTMAAIDRVVEY